MTRRVLIDATNTVVNIIEYDPQGNWQVPDGHTLLDDPGGNIGDVWNGTSFESSAEPQLNVGGFIESLIEYFGVDRANDLMAVYPAFVRALDGGTRWDLAQYLMGKMLSDAVVTQAEYDDVQALWDQFNLPRPE